MADTWGNIGETQREIIKSGARVMSETEIEKRFSKEDGKVIFRIMSKTDRARAGALDLDTPEEEIGREVVAAEEVPEFEIVEVVLISPEDFDYEPKITKEDKAAARAVDEAVAPFQAYYAEDTLGAQDAAGEAVAQLPNVIDHRASQSSVKNQNPRGTCVAHAAMAVLEAYPHIPDDLSEQYAHYKFNEFLSRPHNQDAGLTTTDSAPFLARSNGHICLEANWPYIPNQSTIDQLVANGTYGPPQNAVNDQTYGIQGYKIIPDAGLVGESIKNTRYLEALLYQGYNVVIGTWVSWDDKDNNGVLDPVLDPKGDPIGQGGHAMLIVGYDRDAQYFIVKNSWGTGWGHSGYAYLHYNLARSCFKYGYVVHSVVPPAPPEPLPRRLALAPFSAAKISRDQLRAAILFMKTSRGRFAVCEAYAGYNLLLRNLRVYNPNGSIHLERDSLVVRGTYLFDLDTARETQYDADFWWEAVRPGVNYLVPRNGALACIGYNVAALTAQQIGTIPLMSAPVPSRSLDYAIVVGRTTANLRFKLLAHAKSNKRLQLSYLEVYDGNGNRYRYITDTYVPSSWTYNLDTLQQGGGQHADIWWHVISDNVGFLEQYSTARTQLVWRL